MTDYQTTDYAQRRVAQLRRFYVHCIAFVAGNTLAFLINWMTLSAGDHPWWFQWGLLVWSSALAIHGLTLVGHGRFFGPAWEARKVAEYERDQVRAAAGSQRPGD